VSSYSRCADKSRNDLIDPRVRSLDAAAGNLRTIQARRMRRSVIGNRAIVCIVLLIAVDSVGSERAIRRLRPLVETSAERLAIAKQVALAKWDTHAAVEDTPREASVIMSAVKEAEGKGLASKFVADFFKAQIEANKVVQYSLLAEWHRVGSAPVHSPMNLATGVRPALDKLQMQLIGELADTADIRASATCQVDVAKAVGEYLSAHKYGTGPLLAIALDRALAHTCSF
jgi:chorismate mutase